MVSEKIEKAFYLMDEAIQRMAQATDSSFLDAYIETGENILDEYSIRVVDDIPSVEVTAALAKIYEELKRIELKPEEKRKVAQLLLLKGSRLDHLQTNHQLTPDSIGLLFVHLIEQIYPQKNPIRLLDMASGMGNLLTTISVTLQETKKQQVIGFGVDNDETLLAISAVTKAWIQTPSQLYHQDGLQQLVVDPVDIAIGDLPVGYYPNDETAQMYETATKEGHSYAHHLLMEQAMNYVKPNGYGLFLVPSTLFETEQSSCLKRWLKKKVYLQGIIQLPDELFHSEKSRKSILLLQNRGEDSQQAPEVFLVKMGSLKDSKKVKHFVQQFEEWKSLNLK